MLGPCSRSRATTMECTSIFPIEINLSECAKSRLVYAYEPRTINSLLTMATPSIAIGDSAPRPSNTASPPWRNILTACSCVAVCPTASTTRSTPCPSVMSSTASTGSDSSTLIEWDAPKVDASNRREGTMSVTAIWVAPT